MKKRLLPVLLALAVVVGLLSVPASAITFYFGQKFQFKVVDIHGEEVEGATVTVTHSNPATQESITSKPSKDEVLDIMSYFSYTVEAENYKTVTESNLDPITATYPTNWTYLGTDENGASKGYLITITLERTDDYTEPANANLKAEKDDNAVKTGFWGVKVSGFKAGFFYTIRIASSTAQDNTSVIIPLSGKDVAGTTYSFQCKKGQVVTVNEYTSAEVLENTASGSEVPTITTVNYTCE